MMQEGINVDLPEAKGQPLPNKPDTREIIISISDQGKIFVNDKEVDESNLAPTVLQAREGDKPPEVFLRADKNVPYGSVVRIMASLRAAGVSDLGMITSQEQPSTGR
jgi:biopolymer transport protein TolR